MKVQIIVNRKLPSLNELRHKYANHHAYARLRDGWKHDVWCLIGARNLKLLVAHVDLKHRCKLSIHSERRGKRWELDRDNLLGGCKPVIDAIKACGVIGDDSPKWLDLEVTQQRSPDLRTHITLETIEPDLHEEGRP